MNYTIGTKLYTINSLGIVHTHKVLSIMKEITGSAENQKETLFYKLNIIDPYHTEDQLKKLGYFESKEDILETIERNFEKADK